ncbi:MAG TPA: phage holin family protein [Candidatus Acidoferrales bacterium]|nr:phage holin family protein [Candidatus Acidoferrales bacterium]
MRLILRWLINAVTLLLIAHLFASIEVAGFGAALIAALILGLVNAVIRPVLLIATLPINILTLGLFTFVINALLFWLVASFVEGFEVGGFWSAFFGALAFSIISALLSLLIPGD